MVKRRTIIIMTLILLCIFFVSGCGDPQKKLITYGNFQDNCTGDRFEVSCDWDEINPLLEKHNYEQYGLYSSNDTSFEEFEKYINAIALYNYSDFDDDFNNSSLGAVEVAYGAIESNSVDDQNHNGYRYFAEPMIEIQCYNPKADKGEAEPDYIQGYRAVYSLDGELALEEGQWFLDEDKDEFCEKYVDIMLKVIGKGD